MSRIQVTTQDFERLQALARSVVSASRLEEASAEALQAELAQAELLAPQAVPTDRVTMRSRVTLRDLDSGVAATWTLSYPNEADAASGRLSVLAPLGRSLLGEQAGATVQWRAPAGTKRVKLERLEYQPEAAGDWQL